MALCGIMQLKVNAKYSFLYFNRLLEKEAFFWWFLSPICWEYVAFQWVSGRLVLSEM